MGDDGIGELLRQRYGLVAGRVERLAMGQVTANYRVSCTGREVFVKRYPEGADLQAEAAAVELSEEAGRCGVPVPAVVRGRDGAVIEAGVSVWEWMPGEVILDRLTMWQYDDVGAVLGRIHAAFARLPGSAGAPGSDGAASRLARWLDTSGLAGRVARLRGLAAARIETGSGEVFDRQAARTLAERERMLDELPVLLAELPTVAELPTAPGRRPDQLGLRIQVVHGDYALPNVLLEGDRVAAVLDFRPPEPFLVAYELGRVAFAPDQVAVDPEWLRGAEALVGGYLRTSPEARGEDVRACGRLAAFQLVRSLYGVREHYLGGGLLQEGLDRFWLRRHETARRMLARMDEIDAMLAGFGA